MQNVPKIVRERLKAATPAVNHPDADVLTAFAERSLPELERAIVLEHLARCGDCRDIVALSLPATEAVEAAAIQARGQWFAWPTLRWAFVAAGVVAIASLGVVQLQHREVAQMAGKQSVSREAVAVSLEAKNQTTSLPMVSAPAATEQTKEKKSQVPALVLKDSGNASRQASAASNQVTRAEEPSLQKPPGSRGAVGGVVAGQLSNGPKMPEQWQQRQNAFGLQANAAPAPPPPTAKQTADAYASSNILTTEARQSAQAPSAAPAINTAAENLDAHVQEQPSSPQPESDAVGKAKQPVKVEAQGAASAQETMVAATPRDISAGRNDGANVRNSNQLNTSPSSTFRWIVNSDGGLERSVDRGNSWQGVDVNAQNSASSMSSKLAAKAARAKDKSDTKKEAAATPVFRAVAAMGTEVWAGGSTGALFHSSDGGNHWTRVVPLFAGSTLTGDVVTLEFSDPQHGKITTSTPEVWTTTDAGLTWQKQ
jgi:hypothetical protein